MRRSRARIGGRSGLRGFNRPGPLVAGLGEQLVRLFDPTGWLSFASPDPRPGESAVRRTVA